MATMNRRDWLKVFAAGVAGAMVMDPEKLLWVPGEKTIFLPPTTVLADEPMIASIWQLTLRLEDLREESALLHHFGTVDSREKAQRMIAEERRRHGAFGTMMIEGTTAFKAEWKEVARDARFVHYESIK